MEYRFSVLPSGFLQFFISTKRMSKKPDFLIFDTRTEQSYCYLPIGERNFSDGYFPYVAEKYWNWGDYLFDRFFTFLLYDKEYNYDMILLRGCVM